MNDATSLIQVRLSGDDVAIFGYSHATAVLIRVIGNVPMFMNV